MDIANPYAMEQSDYINGTLSDELKLFLKENFGVDDIDTLSDEAWDDLGIKLTFVEADYICRHKRDTDEHLEQSDYENKAFVCLNYMSYQTEEGGRRWKMRQESKV